ncbi:hypothetical protein Tco_1490945 [Tanacetum coccineum]
MKVFRQVAHRDSIFASVGRNMEEIDPFLAPMGPGEGLVQQTTSGPAVLRNEVVSLRNQQADSAILISSLEVKLRDAEGRLGVEEGSLVRNLRA